MKPCAFLKSTMEARLHNSTDALMLNNMQISACYELKLIVLITYMRVEQTPSRIIILEQDSPHGR